MDISKLWGLFSGKKVFIVSALWGIATFAYGMGWIDNQTYILIQGTLFPAGLASLRAAITTGVGK